MRIRGYTEVDLAAILDIYGRSKLDELKFEDKTFTLLPLAKDEARLRGLMESEIYVCEEKGIISGYGAFYGNEIRALFVLPGCRGKGVGKMLLEFLLSKVQGEPCLNVASSNQPAKRLYQRYGFSVAHSFETTYNRVPVSAQTMIRKALAQDERNVN
ncbi:GNAT family N-acetyltransferase [Ketobacter sp.]